MLRLHITPQECRRNNVGTNTQKEKTRTSPKTV